MATTGSGTPPPPSGVVDSIRAFLASWVALVKTRVDIISVEIEEQREWLQQIMFMAVAALVFISLGVMLLTLLVVVLFWETARLWVLGGFAALYLGVGIVLALSLRQRLKNKPRIFSTTAAELSKDYSNLQPGSP